MFQQVVIIIIICLIGAGLVFFLVKLYQQNSRLLREVRQYESQMHDRVQTMFLSWRTRECDSIRRSERDVAQREATTQLQQLKLDAETLIRNDAIQRSQSTIIGKVTEHLVPYMPNFAFNPKDVRFVGSPIDLIVFDGMNDEELQNIVFVEIKTGASASLTKRERQIRDAVKDRRVQWLELRVDRNTA